MLIRANYREDGSFVIRQAFKRQGMRYKIVVHRFDQSNNPINTDKNSRFSTVALGQIAAAMEDICKNIPDPTKVELAYTPASCFIGLNQADTKVKEQAAIIFNHLSTPCKVGVSKNPGSLIIVPTREKTLKAAPLPASTPKGAASEQTSPISTPRSVSSEGSSVESLHLPPLPAFVALDQVKLTLDGGREITYTQLADYSYKRKKTDQDDLWEVYHRYIAILNEPEDADDELMTDWIDNLIRAAEAYYNDLNASNPNELAQNLVFGHIAIYDNI